MSNLRDLRLAADLTQDYVAQRLSVDQAAVSNWERGKSPPLRKYRPQLCRIYNVTPEELEAAINATRKEST